jgi:hypothetical protein
MTATTRRLIVIVCITIALAAGLFVLLLDLQSRAVALESALQTIANQAAVERTHTILSEVLENTAAERAEVAKYFVYGQEGSVDLLNQIEVLAATHGVELSNPRLTTVESAALNETVLQISYTVSGPQPAVETLLSQLEVLPVASYLDTVAYTIDRPVGSVPTINGSFTLHAVTIITEL